MRVKDNVYVAALAVAAVWVVFLLEKVFPGLMDFGIQPRSLGGLWGLLFGPFLHANYQHIMANTPPLFVLLLLSLSYSRALTAEAVVIIAGAGGGLVWLFGARYTNHIGASGIVFGLIGFLLFLGLFRRDARALVVSVLVLFMYGGALLSGFLPQAKVSWMSHLFGFLAGALSARLAGPPPKEGTE
ncbi:MAG: rhomboid family intramembrane serine protease [Thermodesulfobacteriota bacterium]